MLSPHVPAPHAVAALCCALTATVSAAGAATEAGKRSFNLPRGDAAATLKEFAAAAGTPIVYLVERVRGETTNAVRGEFTPRDALERMLAGSALEAAQDAATGALVVSRKRTADTAPRPGEVEPVSDPKARPATVTKSPRTLLAALAGWLAFGSAADAQTTPAASASQSASGSANQSSTTVVTLSPFEVQADSDTSYGALSSASITRFNIEMEKLPVSADIFTEAFMKDIAATSVEELVQGFSAGAGFASPVDNGVGSAVANQPGDRVPGDIQLRGMNTPRMQRDGFMPLGLTGVGRTDTFDIERVEVINGPQSLLYGGGGAGGVITVNSKAARFGSRPRGSLLYRVDQYGSKRGEFDLSFGSPWVAVRVATINESTSSRRINIGGMTAGQYGQLAFRFLQKTTPTTLRLNTTTTLNRRRLSTTGGPAFNSAGDARNGMLMRYLLATDQTGATHPVTGAPYAAGPILNGKINWGNVDSFGAGHAFQEVFTNQFYGGTMDTKWTSWLTTQVGGGYNATTNRRINPGLTLLAPNVAANPTPNWLMASTPNDSWQPSRSKAGRFAALVTRDFFGRKARTQSLFGADIVRTDTGQIAYSWYQADANWNAIVAPGSTPTSAAAGRTPLTQQRWVVNDGPVLYPFDNPALDRAVFNGVNYVRALVNPPQPNLVSAANPHGAPNTGNYIQTKVFNKGLYGVNYTQWLDGSLNTLVGFRRVDFFSHRVNQPGGLQTRWQTKAAMTNFNVGVDWKIARWLHPYASFSDSVQPPVLASASDPYGDAPSASHGIGGEFGLKFNSADRRFTGTLLAYKTSARNDNYAVNAAISQDINPVGLNGGGGGATVNVDRVTTGMQAQFTAALTRNWRMRFSGSIADGKIGTAKSYDQLYNDQFYANAAGQVTYRNGTPVLVNGAATIATQATVVAAGTPGATPLTIAMMSTPTSIFWANPDLQSGAINTTSVAATILRGTNNTANLVANGPILTGTTRLPISQLQLDKQLAGIVPPGTIVATRVGDKTTGSPERSMNFTSVYTFTDSFLEGLSLGGTVQLSWGNRTYYYYATPVNSTNALTLRRTLHYAPDGRQFGLIASYARKFGRYRWSTQLNVSNLFNRYSVRLLPNATTGFNNPTAINATFYQQPRAAVWTNTIGF